VNFLEKTNTLNCIQKFLFWIGCILNLLSIGFGILVVLNRLDDFRLTAQIARKRETGVDNGIQNNRKKSKEKGGKSWCYFKFQIALFLIGFISLLVLVLIENIDKIV